MLINHTHKNGRKNLPRKKYTYLGGVKQVISGDQSALEKVDWSQLHFGFPTPNLPLGKSRLGLGQGETIVQLVQQDANPPPHQGQCPCL